MTGTIVTTQRNALHTMVNASAFDRAATFKGRAAG